MNRNSTKGMNQPMKTANNNTLACICTRARALAHALPGACLSLLLMILFVGNAWGQKTELVTGSNSSYNTKTQLGGSDGKTHVKITKIECWGAGGGGGKGKSQGTHNYSGGGGGGGEYYGVKDDNNFIPLDVTLNISIGDGGSSTSTGGGNGGKGGDTEVKNGGTSYVLAKGGNGGGCGSNSGGTGGTGGTKNDNLTKINNFKGGTGGTGLYGSRLMIKYCGGGGAGAGSATDGVGGEAAQWEARDGHSTKQVNNGGSHDSNPGSGNGEGRCGSRDGNPQPDGYPFGGGGGGTGTDGTTSGKGGAGGVRLTYVTFNAGSISSSTKTICVGGAASKISSTKDAESSTEGVGTITYQWYVKVGSGSYTAIDGATGKEYTPGTTYTGTPGTYKFKRHAKSANYFTSGYDSDNEYTLVVNAYPTLTIDPATQTVCSGKAITTINITSNAASVTTSTLPAGLSYANSKISGSITNNGSGSVNYSITVSATSNNCTTDAYPAIEVLPAFVKGSITDNSNNQKNICVGGSVDEIQSLTNVSGGNGDIKIQWYVSKDGGAATSISGATNQTFTPGWPL